MISSAAALLLAASLGLGVPAAAAEPERACRVTDGRLTEISGLAATPGGYVVVNDGADDPAARRIFFLDERCRVDRAVAYPSRPRDTEDLARAADGTVWVGDIGDNGRNRETIALWRLAPSAKRPELIRMTYPDGPHDAEALLLNGDGTPIVVTKEPGGGGIYVPAGRATALRKAGSVRVPLTTTSNPFGFAGRLVITGGAVGPDGRHAVLRTYADAFEFEVTDGDVVRALTGGSSRTIPLPDEPQGEAIAYAVDGTALLTVSEGERPQILRYPLPEREPAPSAPSSPSSSPETRAAPAPEPRDSSLPYGLIGLGVGLVVVAGLVLAFRGRRR